MQRLIEMSKRTITTAGLAFGLLTGGTLYAVNTEQTGGNRDRATQTTVAADTESVTRGDLVTETKAVGTIGYGTAVALPIDAKGLVTTVSAAGSTVEPGAVLATVNGRPIYLALGTTPLYRELRRVPASERDEAGARLGELKGDDVKQLQTFLLSGGFDDDDRLTADGVFGKSTERAVKAWQKEVGHPATGKVNRSQLVFVPDAVRISEAPAVGEEFSGIKATPNKPIVSAEVDAKKAGFFDIGAAVNLATSAVTSTGTVTKTTPKIDDEGKRTLAIEIEPDDDFGSAMSVEINAQQTLAADVPVVPVRALVALADGGWALQVSGQGLVPVKIVLVQDGQAQIDGVDEGTKIEVPT